jgi:hypothetical protein
MAAVCGTGLAGGAARAQPDAIVNVAWLTHPVADTNPARIRIEEPPGTPDCLRIRRVSQDSARTTIYCSVLDVYGEPVFGLSPTDLRLSAGGRILEPSGVELLALCADEHLAIVLALGLTEGRVRAPRVLSALSSAFVPELEEGKSDLCALLTLDGRIAVPRLFSSDPMLLKQALSSIHFSGEGLVLNAAIDAARTLIHQHDASGFGAVVLVFDDAAALGPGSLAAAPAEDPRTRVPVFALGLGGPAEASWLPLGGLVTPTGGEALVAADDSVSIRNAVGRVIRVLQRQYVIRVPGPLSGRLRIEYAGEATGRVLADSVVLSAIGPTVAPGGAQGTSRVRLVVTSLGIGVALLALILALHARSRAQ